MGKADNDGEARASALAFLDDIERARGPRIADLHVHVGDLSGLTIDGMRDRLPAALNAPGSMLRLVKLASMHLPVAERLKLYGSDPLDGRARRDTDDDECRHHRETFRSFVQELRHRVSGDREQWLPIDKAAQQAGWKLNKQGRCDAARRAAKWKRKEPLPTRKVHGKLHALVSDCRKWKPLAEENAEAFSRPESRPRRNPAIPRNRVPGGSGRGADRVEGGHGNPN